MKCVSTFVVEMLPPPSLSRFITGVVSETSDPILEVFEIQQLTPSIINSQ